MGSLWQMGYYVRFHEEQSYAGLPYIDAMVRRRLYWLCVGIDKSSAAVANKVVMITREHCATVHLPTAMYVQSANFLEKDVALTDGQR